MRQIFARRFLSGSAFALVACLGLGSVLTGVARAETAPQPAADGFTIDDVDSFSGAYLAARTANADRDFPLAVALYGKALRYEPNDKELRESLMLSHFMAGNFVEGVKLARDLRKDPAVERITTMARGLDAIRTRDYKEAEKILAYKGPNDLDRLTNALLVAWARMGAGRGKEAIAQIEALKGPGWYAIFKNYNIGAMAAAIGDTAKARSALSSVITDREGGATAPDTYLRAVMALATLEARDGNRQKAMDAIAAGDEMITNYAPFKALQQQIEKGEKPEQVIRTADQGAASVLFSIGGALNRQGAQDTVALYLQLSRALYPDAADMLILLGGIAEANKQNDLAISYYKLVKEESPMRRISELQLGLALAETGKDKEARDHLKGLIASDPADIRSYLAYGSVLSDAKDYAEMADNYDKAVAAIGPTPAKSHWSVFFQRGIAYERLKKWDQAEPNFRKALELNPDQPQVLNYLGYSWVDMNRNLQEGLEMIKKAVELKPDDGYIVDSLGWAYYRLGRFDEAVEELERAVQLKAGDATINDHLGDAYWRVDRKLEAVFQWRQALAFKPEADLEPKIREKLENGLPALPAGENAAEAKPEGAPPPQPSQPEQKPADGNAPAPAPSTTPDPAAPAPAVDPQKKS
ncbi:tetratricopeptide repeat protein [Allorhizobium undicola]|uniref:tetratricopeptide repeat protein n=1 Tax=Allorhizobium undicola TaxID=78527 RepID=UPI003D336A45